MAKKPASFEYNAKLIKVLDGDTIDAWIDLGFDLMIKKRIRYMGFKLNYVKSIQRLKFLKKVGEKKTIFVVPGN